LPNRVHVTLVEGITLSLWARPKPSGQDNVICAPGVIDRPFSTKEDLHSGTAKVTNFKTAKKHSVTSNFC